VNDLYCAGHCEGAAALHFLERVSGKGAADAPEGINRDIGQLLAREKHVNLFGLRRPRAEAGGVVLAVAKN